MKLRHFALLFGFWIIVFSLAQCAGLPTVTPTTKATIRVQAARIMDAATIGLTIADQAGAVADAAPISVQIKNSIDCSILAAVGIDEPSAKVIMTCGPEPTKAGAPLRKAIKLLNDAASGEVLSTAKTLVQMALVPLLDRLEQSGNAALASMGAILRTTLLPAMGGS